MEAGAVLVGGAAADKAARLVAAHDPVVVLGVGPRFVSRGGDKLAAALETFGIDVARRRALDAGASTGGFTDCLLQAGAAEVVAVDVGYGQLHPRLRADPRVTVLERTDLRHLPAQLAPHPRAAPAGGGWPSEEPGPPSGGQPAEAAGELAGDQLGPAPGPAAGEEPGPAFGDAASQEPTTAFDVVVADLSFISLTAVVPLLAGPLAGAGADLVLLVKPQFEAGRREVSRGRGVIRDPQVRRRAVQRVASAVEAAGASIMGVMASPVAGRAGNVEYLLHARAHLPPDEPSAGASPEALAADLDRLFPAGDQAR